MRNRIEREEVRKGNMTTRMKHEGIGKETGLSTKNLARKRKKNRIEHEEHNKITQEEQD